MPLRGGGFVVSEQAGHVVEVRAQAVGVVYVELVLVEVCAHVAREAEGRAVVVAYGANPIPGVASPGRLGKLGLVCDQQVDVLAKPVHAVRKLEGGQVVEGIAGSGPAQSKENFTHNTKLV